MGTQLAENEFFFVKDELQKQMLIDGYEAVLKCNMYDYIKNNDIDTYMFTDDENILKLYEFADKNNLHSGWSYGWTMAAIDSIVKDGFYNWKYNYIMGTNKNLYNEMMLSKYMIQNTYKKCKKDEKYKLCRDKYKEM